MGKIIKSYRPKMMTMGNSTRPAASITTKPSVTSNKPPKLTKEELEALALAKKNKEAASNTTRTYTPTTKYPNNGTRTIRHSNGMTTITDTRTNNKIAPKTNVTTNDSTGFLNAPYFNENMLPTPKGVAAGIGIGAAYYGLKKRLPAITKAGNKVTEIGSKIYNLGQTPKVVTPSNSNIYPRVPKNTVYAKSVSDNVYEVFRAKPDAWKTTKPSIVKPKAPIPFVKRTSPVINNAENIDKLKFKHTRNNYGAPSKFGNIDADLANAEVELGKGVKAPPKVTPTTTTVKGPVMDTYYTQQNQGILSMPKRKPANVASNLERAIAEQKINDTKNARLKNIKKAQETNAFNRQFKKDLALETENIAKQKQTIEQNKLRAAASRGVRELKKQNRVDFAKEINASKRVPTVTPTQATSIPPTEQVIQAKLKASPNNMNVTLAEKLARANAANEVLKGNLGKGTLNFEELQNTYKGTIKSKVNSILEASGKSGLKGTLGKAGMFAPIGDIIRIFNEDRDEQRINDFNIKNYGEVKANMMKKERDAAIKEAYDRQLHPNKYGNVGTLAYGGKLPQKGFGDIMLNAASGAASGAATGSVIPGWGTAVGAIAGLGMGVWKGLIANKAEKKEEELRKKSEADMLAAQGKLDQQYMANYKPNNMVSMFAMGGDLPGSNVPLSPRQKSYSDSLMLHNYSRDVLTNGALDYRKQELSRQALDKLGLSLEGNSKYMPSEQLDFDGQIVVKGDNPWDINANTKIIKGKGKVDTYKMPINNASNVNTMTPRGLQKKAYGGKVDSNIWQQSMNNYSNVVSATKYSDKQKLAKLIEEANNKETQRIRDNYPESYQSPLATKLQLDKQKEIEKQQLALEYYNHRKGQNLIGGVRVPEGKEDEYARLNASNFANAEIERKYTSNTNKVRTTLEQTAIAFLPEIAIAKGLPLLKQATNIKNISKVSSKLAKVIESKPVRVSGKDITKAVSDNSSILNEIEDFGTNMASKRLGEVSYPNNSTIAGYSKNNRTVDTYLGLPNKLDDSQVISYQQSGARMDKDFKRYTPINRFHIKADLPNTSGKDVKALVSNLQEYLPPFHTIEEGTNISTDGIKMWGNQLKHGYTQTDEFTRPYISAASKTENLGGLAAGDDKFTNLKFNSVAEREQGAKAINELFKQYGLKGGVREGIRSKLSLQIDLPVLQRLYIAMGVGVGKAVNANVNSSEALIKKAFGSQLNNVEIPDNNSIPINPNAEIVTNNQGGLTGSHATGVNVPAVGANGRPVALLEPKEVKMKDSKGTNWVLSHRLGMAQKYVQLNSMLEKANALYAQESNVTKRNTIARNIDKYKQMMDMLPQQQEIMKQQLGIKDAPQKGWGDVLNSAITSVNNNNIKSPLWTLNNASYSPSNEQYLALQNAQKSQFVNSANSLQTGVRTNPIDKYNYQSSINPNLLNINNIGKKVAINNENAFRVSPEVSNRFVARPNTLSSPMPNPSTLGEHIGKLKYNIGKGVDQLGGIGGVAKLASSFLTNALNNRDLNKQMDKVNNLKATPLKYRNLDDKVDYSAQQQGVEQSYRDAVSSTRGLSDSRTAAMMKGKFASDRVSMLNPIIENANNTSRGIRNQNVVGNNTILNANVQQQNELDRYKTEQSVGLGLAKITGRNQTLDNIYTILKEKNISDNDRTTMDLIVKTLNNNEVIDRNLAAEYERITGKKYTGKIG